MNFCPYCGNKLPSGCNFCPFCGRKLQVAVIKAESEVQPKTDVYLQLHSYDLQKLSAAVPESSVKRGPKRYAASGLTASDVLAILQRQCEILQAFIDRVEDNYFYSGLQDGLFCIIQSISRSVTIVLSSAEYGHLRNYYSFLLTCVDCLTKTDANGYAEQIDDWLKELDSVGLILDEVQIAEPGQSSATATELAPVKGDFYPEVADEIASLNAELKEFNPSIKRTAYDRSIDYIAELQKLIGLDSVKTRISHIIQDYKLQQQRLREHPDLKSVVSTNFIFKGRPGTGKTTVARLVAGILKNEGLLDNGCCVETDASTLVSAYMGVPAKITKLAALQAVGGVLFIDEAYALANHKGTKSDIGAEVIDTLTPLMENYRGKLVVILAGYNDEMDKFLAESNTGFPSRFKSILDFEDYNPDEMMDIFLKMATAEHYRFDEDALSRVYVLLQYIYSRKDSCRTFANARTVRSLFETIRGKSSVRMSSESATDLDRIILSDVSLTADELKSIGAI